MPFDIWSELVVTALCGASLVVSIGRDLAARGREWRTGVRIDLTST